MRTPSGLPSASKLQLALSCPASQVLPVVDSEWAAGESGREKHAALADWVTAPPDAKLDLPAQMAAWLETVTEYADEMRHPDTISEMALTYDVATGQARHLGANLGRAYPERTPSEFYGALDYVRHDGDSVMVADLKTGMSDVPHPARNMQLRFGALAAARHFGVESARVGILHAPEGRTPWWSWATLDAFELEMAAAELRTLAERIGYARNDAQRGKTPRLTVGEHCTYCPARHGCPARVAMAKRLAGEPEKVVLDLRALLTPETSALALARWQAASRALHEVGAALHAYAAESPIPLGDGRVWGPRESEREVIDAERAWPVLVERYGVEVARAAMSIDTSKAGVSRAMAVLRESMRGAAERPRGVGDGRVTLKSLNEDALRALREAGCVTSKTTKSFEVYAVAPGISPTASEGQPEPGRTADAARSPPKRTASALSRSPEEHQ